MNGKILTSFIICLVFFLLINPFFLLAQVIDSCTIKSKQSNLEAVILNQLDFGFTVPDSSIITEIMYVENKGFVAFDNSGIELFIILTYDNGPDYISEGMFRIVDGDKIGFANELGEIVIIPRFSAVYPFRNGRAAFCEGCITVMDNEHKRWTGGRWGFINRNGEVVIPPSFDKIISDFKDGYANVELEGRILTINKKGERIEVE